MIRWQQLCFFARSSRRTFHKVRPSTDPDVRLSRIRLLIWLIVCLISVYLTLFSLKSFSSSCQSLCIGQVSFLDIAICGSLPSSGITHLQRYYWTIRPPIFLLLTRHTLLLFFLKLRKYRLSPVDIQSLYYMNRSFRRRGAVWNLTLTINPHIAFPSVHRVGTPIYSISALNCCPCNLAVYA